jgi:hypothetical protein
MRLGKRQDDKTDDDRGLRPTDDKGPGGRSEVKAGSVRGFAGNFPPPAGSYKEHELLASRLSPTVRDLLRQRGFRVDSGKAGFAVVTLPKEQYAWDTLRQLQAQYSREGFALNYLYQAINDRYEYALDDAPIEGRVAVNGSVGCDTQRCYGRQLVAWQKQLSTCAKGVKIGVIDTGYDERHPAFRKLEVMGKALPRYVMRPEGAARAPNWHGTGVLSLLAASAVSGTPGMIPDADFLVADAFFAGPTGKAQTDTAHLLEALSRLDEEGAQIINMSLVGPRDDLIHERIMVMSERKGVVFVAAAGNGGRSAMPGYQAAYEQVIAVTAVDDKGRGYADANRGDYIDVAAPGVRIWAALPDAKEGMLTGTSFAVPFVTAIVAVKYNASPLKAQIRENRAPLNPKRMMLAGFAIDSLGQGGPEDQKTFGLGLAKAPANCTTNEPPPATARAAPPAAARVSAPAWLTDIQRASLQ